MVIYNDERISKKEISSVRHLLQTGLNFWSN